MGKKRNIFLVRMSLARAAQHSRMIKDKHYKKAGTEEIRESFRKHHPAFTGEI